MGTAWSVWHLSICSSSRCRIYFDVYPLAHTSNILGVGMCKDSLFLNEFSLTDFCYFYKTKKKYYKVHKSQFEIFFNKVGKNVPSVFMIIPYFEVFQYSIFFKFSEIKCYNSILKYLNESDSKHIISIQVLLEIQLAAPG